MNNVFYFYNINKIGGIETFFYYLAKKYKNYDITIYYQVGDLAQIKRLSQYVRVKKYTGEKIKCKKIFFNFNLDIIKNADYIIDLGPNGGDNGGTIVASGTPEEVALCEKSYTGLFLKKVL